MRKMKQSRFAFYWLYFLHLFAIYNLVRKEGLFTLLPMMENYAMNYFLERIFAYRMDY